MKESDFKKFMEAGKRAPKEDFTEILMERIQSEKKKSPVMTRIPPIWPLIGAGFLLLVIGLLFISGTIVFPEFLGLQVILSGTGGKILFLFLVIYYGEYVWRVRNPRVG